MDTLQMLGTALGLGTLAGINLYLTVFVAGLAIQQGWIVLQPQYEQLSVLADPAILWVSGILFLLQFFADKVPWVDSLWDSVHTFIRPVGAAMLAITALGDAHPVYDVLIGLLAGGMALTTHGVKAGTRLLVNASPEPFSNIGLSLTEDATVVAGLALVYKYPVVALCVSLAAVAVAIWLLPKLLGAARAMLWFGWRRVRHAIGAPAAEGALPELPPHLEIELHRCHGSLTPLLWAAPCVTGPGEHLRRNRFGWLLLTEAGLSFARKADSKPALQSLPMPGWKATHRRGWVCDKVVLYEVAGSGKQIFQFDRSRRAQAIALVELLARQAKTPQAEAQV
jgi:hypothetical protein